MADLTIARQTRNHYQDQLFTDHPDIVSLAPRWKRDKSGRQTDEAYIAVGVRKLRPGIDDENVKALVQPFRLPGINDQDEPIPNVMVDFVIEREGTIRVGSSPPQPSNSTPGRFRPCPGGYAITHLADTTGTLGGVVHVNSTWGYILCCNHVLTGFETGAVGDAIYQPDAGSGSLSSNHIASLHRWLPLDYGPLGNNVADVALARVLSPWDSFVAQGVTTIGVPTALGDPGTVTDVRLYGQASGPAAGVIVGTEVTFSLSYSGGNEARFLNGFQFARYVGGLPAAITTGGDSGALVWDAATATVLGIHTGFSDLYSYGIVIGQALRAIGDAVTAFDGRGRPVAFPSATVGLF
jgi:hypothetical protein